MSMAAHYLGAAVATDWQTLQEKYAWRPLTPQQRNFVEACEANT